MKSLLEALERSSLLLNDMSDVSILEDFTGDSGLYELSGMLRKAAINQRQAIELIKTQKMAIAALEEAKTELAKDLIMYKEEYKSMSAFLNKEGWKL